MWTGFGRSQKRKDLVEAEDFRTDSKAAIRGLIRDVTLSINRTALAA